MRRRARLVSLLWRWHRRLGLGAAFLVLFLATSGIALNHTSDLGLDREQVSSSLVYALYGVEPQALQGFRLGEHWISRPGGTAIYLDTSPVAECSGELVGAVRHAGWVFVACTGELLALTAEGELIESLSASSGLPVPVEALATSGGELELRAGGEWYRVDFDALAFDSLPPEGNRGSSAQMESLPAALAAALPNGVDWLTWERVLLDLHSGRLAGWLGVALVDALGLALCILGLSGFAMWWLHRHRG